MAALSADMPASFSQVPMEKAVMTRDEALKQLSHIAHARAFDKHVGSDQLIQAGLDALIAGVESPSLAMLAGLLRSEEPEGSGTLRPGAGGVGPALSAAEMEN